MKTCLLPQAFPPAGFIPRHLYDALLNQLVSHRLSLLCAPGGYGKSTALAYCAQHIHRTGAQAVWVSAEQVSANGQADLLQAIAAQLCIPEPASIETLLTRLLNLKTPLVIVIDAYEELENAPNDLLLEKLLQLNQPLLHIALACRHQPSLKLSTLELRGQLFSLTTAQLNFSADETSLLLGRELPSGQCEHLHQLTEGWPLAIGLCRALARDKKQAAQLLAFSGRDHRLRTFFEEQVLVHLDTRQHSFLNDFALLGQGTAALCDYALRRTDSQEMLERLSRAGAFIEASDRNQDGYRLHRLFRELLLERRQGNSKPRRPLLRATHWSLRHQQYRQAADYARASGEPRVARLVINKTSEVLVRNLGELPTLVEWTRDMQVSAIGEWNELVYWSTWSLAFSYCWQDAQQRIQQLRQAMQSDTGLTTQDRLGQEAKLDTLGLVLAIFQDQTGDVPERSASWLACNGNADAFDTAVIASAQLIALRLEANVLGMQNAEVRALSAIRHAGSVYGGIWVNLLSALSQLEFGDYSRARQQLNEQFYLATQEIGEHSAILSTCALLLARVAYEQNDLDDASAYVDIGYRQIKSHGLIETAIAGISVRARLAARSSASEALQVFDQAQSILSVYPPRLEILLHQQRIELLLDLGRSSEALIAASALEHLLSLDTQGDTRAVPQSNQRYIQLLLLCAREQYEAARQYSAELLDTPIVKAQPLLHCRILIIQAYLLAHAGNSPDKAVQILRQALNVAAENNLYRVFHDLKRFSLIPLQLQLNAGEQHLSMLERALLKRLCEDLQLRAQTLRKGHVLPEPLSRRELELLAFLESGLTYQQIADKLFISLATVKWHVYNIYGKLGVKNRSGALVAARQLNLLTYSD